MLPNFGCHEAKISEHKKIFTFLFGRTGRWTIWGFGSAIGHRFLLLLFTGLFLFLPMILSKSKNWILLTDLITWSTPFCIPNTPYMAYLVFQKWYYVSESQKISVFHIWPIFNTKIGKSKLLIHSVFKERQSWWKFQ